jgi:HEAT repeats
MASGRAADREDPNNSKRRAARSLDRDPISELHQGQRSDAPHQRAGHMTAPDHFAETLLNILRRRGPSTYEFCTFHGGRTPRPFRPIVRRVCCVLMSPVPASAIGADLVELLAVPYRATAAYRDLLELGQSALPAVRRGMRHSSSDVRFHCCRFLDTFMSPDTLPDLISMLEDSDPRVRETTLHTLACDRCKEGSCRPEEAQVLPLAMRLLASDPNAHVRAMAIEVLGHFVHGNSSAVSALEAAAQSDENPAVRKKARWYAPGGPIYQRSLPKLAVVSADAKFSTAARARPAQVCGRRSPY